MSKNGENHKGKSSNKAKPEKKDNSESATSRQNAIHDIIDKNVEKFGDKEKVELTFCQQNEIDLRLAAVSKFLLILETNERSFGDTGIEPVIMVLRRLIEEVWEILDGKEPVSDCEIDQIGSLCILSH